MGLNKIEKDFREKLSHREIQPSENSWDRLHAMLEITEEKKPKSKSSWLYIAAAIISFIAIGTVFLSQTEQVIDSPREEIIVETKVDIPTHNVDSVNSSIQNPKGSIANNNNQVATAEKHPKLELQHNHQSPTNAIPLENQLSKSESIVVNNQSSINKTEMQVLSTVTKVDALLAAVNSTESRADINIIKVDAKNLLSQVDGEIKISFREKVIRTVSKNYQEVAEAVSNRNIQN